MICHAPNSFGSCSNMLQHLMLLMWIGVSITLLRLATCWTCWNMRRTDTLWDKFCQAWIPLKRIAMPTLQTELARTGIGENRICTCWSEISRHPPTSTMASPKFQLRGFSYFENIYKRHGLEEHQFYGASNPLILFELFGFVWPAEDNQQKFHPAILVLNHTHVQSMASPNGRARQNVAKRVQLR